MTLPPSQNQYPGWQPDNRPNGPIDPNQPLPMNQPVQPTQQAQQMPGQYTQMGQQSELIGESADTNKAKLKFKGPLIVLGSLVGLMIIITVVALMSSSGSGNNANNSNSSAQPQQPVQSDEQSLDSSGESGDQGEAQPDRTFTFINNAQQDNLENLMTKIITKQGQTKGREPIPVSQAGWASLQADDVVDPVTHKPYSFTTSNKPEVGQVKYIQASVCSKGEIIDGTDATSFALKTRLFDGSYYCVDSKNK